MLFFFFCLIVGIICSGRMQKKNCSSLSMSWKDFFFLHVGSICILRFLLGTSIMTISLWTSNGDAISFPYPKRKSVVLNSSKNCRCLQAQWWKAKSLLDRWNLRSGYVSSMESNCWASENFSKCRSAGNSSKCQEKKNDENV